MTEAESAPREAAWSIATLNTRGLPPFGTHRAERLTAIGAAFETSGIEVLAFQEVNTYGQLLKLSAQLPSYPYRAYAATPFGPAGGLVVLARIPITQRRFHRFGAWRRARGLPWHTTVMAALKGSLVVRLPQYGTTLVNTHPSANHDGDWSPGGRYAPLQQGEFATLARLVTALPEPVVVCGDFNVPGDSQVHRDFMAATGLTDAFDGRCPPTFHAEFLPAGAAAHCIDFILVGPGLRAEHTQVMLDEPAQLPSGSAYLSDHVALRADLRGQDPTTRRPPSGADESFGPGRL